MHSFQKLALGAFLLLLPAKAAADDSYSWRDANGRLVYGSTPPPQASSVTKLNTKGISRYSSDRLLKRLGWEKKETKSDVPERPVKRRPASAQAAQLEAEQPQIALNEKKEITGCKVAVRNTGEKAASEISVAFEFADGTLVPGVGPDDIAAGQSGDYQVPEELLPIELHLQNETAEAPLPRVILHGMEG